MSNPIEIWQANKGLIMEPIKGFYDHQNVGETELRRDQARDVSGQLAKCVLSDVNRVLGMISTPNVDSQKQVEDACYGLALTVWRAVRAEKAYNIYARMLGTPSYPPASVLTVAEIARDIADGSNVVYAIENVLSMVDPDESEHLDDLAAACNFVGA